MIDTVRSGNGGWLEVWFSELAGPIHVRMRDIDGRLRPTELYIGPDSAPLDSTSLRKINLGALEAAVNGGRLGADLRLKMKAPAPDLERAASYFDSTLNPAKVNHWAAQMLFAQVPGSGVRQAQPNKSERVLHVHDPVDAHLAVPKRRPYGDDFYRDVAALYEELVAAGEAYGPAIADANAVMLTQVHRWVREARRRGFLPEGTRGKVG
jgi:hypothetical protein